VSRSSSIPGSRHLFRKPGGVASACAIGETQVEASLRVFGVQYSVFGKSKEFGTEPQNLAPGTGERSPDATETRLFF
jgi:hypothetical protein